ncbi:PKD repeat protein/type 1 glutamine amidotransferase [Nocardioides cavernae]|uniref:PKD repeat protein/type 1 glutamine amidotransferase n=1 Tax=Nocardioides cavernae TaxID=1921566 RepID=A0A7Y9KRC1_9ACTN|nr:ThuA domain-containing protein [Nocardioides cavernae]NYE38606.1 PKD repeat protein/type 1 glutamine amidotransferase [Nocardioides cavernae]
MSRFRSPSQRARTSVVGLLAAAVAGSGLAAAPAAAAERPAAKQSTPARSVAPTHAGHDHDATPLAVEPTYDVLVFSKTTGFRHGSIGAGIRSIRRLGAQYGFTVDATEDATQFTAANLEKYEAVVWLSTTSDVLNDTQQAAFEDYIQAGGGYVGVHAASDTEYTWPWYGQLVGAYFQSHPAGTPTATIDVEDKATPSSCALPDRWERTDEWYNFQSPANPVVNGGGADYSPRVNENINVIASLDESTYEENDGAPGDDDHPIAWYQEFDGGRSFYTGGGHTDESFSEPLFRLHLLGGIQYAAGEAPDGCTPPPPTDESFEQVTLAKGVDKVGEPMSISVLPDGRVLHNARDGRIFLTDLEGNTTLLYDVPIYSHDEDGLQSLTVSPTFDEDGWVYLYYAPPLSTPAGDAPVNGTAQDFATWQGYNVLTRMKLVDDELDPTTEQELLRVEADRGICCHAGGAIDFDADGNLYLSTGDDSNPFESDGYAPLDERATRNPAFDAQRSSANTNDLRGKVLRITPDPAAASYTVPDGNLFPEASDTQQKTRPEIYAMGFRNPFRMTVDKRTGYVYLGEYGPDAGGANPTRGPGGIVEFNQIREAGNFGWPYCAGTNTAAETYNDWNFATNSTGPKFDCSAPVNNSPRNTGLTNLPPAQPAWIKYDGGSVTYNGVTTNEFGGGGEGPMAGPVYNFDPDLDSDVKFPEYFDNHFFAGEWTRGWIRDVAMEADGDVAGIDPFFDSMTLYAAMDMEFGPDGSLYVLDYGNGGYFTGNENSAVYKINAINDGARSPSATASATPDSGVAPLTVQFSSEGSSDPDTGDSIASYAWDFQNDGSVDSTQPNPTFVYEDEGVYDARLTVTDTTGRTGVATVVITVGNTRPTVEIEMPPNGGFFEFGDSVQVSVDVTDPEDGDVDCTKVDIEYILGHDSHGHPLSSRTGCDVLLPTVADGGHDPSANIFGVINASYTDEGADGVRALSGEDEVVLQPKRKQAEHFSSQQGVGTEATTDPLGGSRNLSNIDAGDHVSFEPVSLYQVPKLRFRVASAGAGGTIEARLDSPTGALAGSVAVPVTGGWQQWRFVDMDIAASAQEGSHELFLVFTNDDPAATGLFNVNFFDAAGKGVSANSRPQVGAEGTPRQGTAPLTVDFTGSATDFDGDPLTYAWDFGVPGDADTATTLDASYTYTEPGTYTARLTATDSNGLSGYSTVPIRVLNACGVQQSDEFDGTSLDGKWDVIRDSGEWSVENGGLQLPINSGSLYGIGGNAEDIIVQDAPEGEFEVTAKITAEVSENYHQAGLRLYSDDENWASVHLISAGGARDVEFIYEADGVPRNNAEDKLGGVPAGFPSTYWVRLVSDGTDLRAFYSADGEAFSPVGRPASLSTFDAPKIGPAAVSGGAPSSPTATFDWIRFEPDGTSGSTDPSDEFDGPGLDDCRWNASVREDPSRYEVEDGALTITTTGGDLYQDSDASGTSNLILQSAGNTTDDYTLETRVSTTFTDGYAQAGLIVYGDDDNYVKLDPISDTGAGRINRVELRSERNAAILDPQPQLDAPANVSSYRLRLTKDGTSYLGEVAFDGGAWQSVGTVTHPDEGMDFGLFAIGVQQPDRTASFDYFRVTPAEAANRPPVADDDTATTTAGKAVNIPVLSGDTDPDGDTLTVESVTAPGDGTATVNDNGTVRYTPDAGFTGTDTFDYTVSDGNGGSDVGTVTVTVVEDCGFRTPDDTFDGASLDTCRWNAIVAGDADTRRVADGRLFITTTPGEIYQTGTGKSNLVLQSADHAGADWELETHADVTGLDGGYSQAGLMAYGDDANYVKIVAISDENRPSPNRVELRSEVNNVIVGANPQPELEVPAGTDLTDLRLRLTKDGSTYAGSASFDGGDTWVDMPRTVENAMFEPRFGVFAAGVLQEGDEVSFDAFLVDGEDPVDPGNAAPVAVDDTATTAQDTAVGVKVLANDTDADGDALSVQSVTKPAHGTAVAGADGTVTYTPAAGWSGTDTFDYVVSDGTDSDTGTVTVTVTKKPDGPAAPDTTITGSPRDTTRAKTANLRFAATGPGAAGATFECSLDGSAWAACTSPKVYRDLRDGEHEFAVRAVGAGGADATPATVSWTVDRTGPKVRKASPTGSTRDRTPTIGAVVTDRLSDVRGRDLTLVVDGTRARGISYDARTGKVTWTPKRGLAPGRHTVKLVAEDAVGNRTVEKWRFTVRR